MCVPEAVAKLFCTALPTSVINQALISLATMKALPWQDLKMGRSMLRWGFGSHHRTFRNKHVPEGHLALFLL